MSLPGSLYVGLHFVLGVICGSGVCHGVGAQRRGPPYYKVWLIYLISMALCFGLLAGIYEIKRMQLLNDAYSWSGAAAIVIGFFLPILKRCKQRR